MRTYSGVAHLMYVGQPVLPAAFVHKVICGGRRLPHIVPDDTPIFVTWRLAGTLPKWRGEGLSYLEQDDEWDRSSSGARWLADERVGEMVAEAILHGKTSLRYQLHAYVVMPNHVHVVWTPLVHMSRVLEWLKGTTARRANRILGRTGAFWQDESYDHWIRDGKEMTNIVAYVEWNPVGAGLVRCPEDWPWSSASRSTGSRQDRLPHRGS